MRATDAVRAVLCGLEVDNAGIGSVRASEDADEQLAAAIVETTPRGGGVIACRLRCLIPLRRLPTGDRAILRSE